MTSLKSLLRGLLLAALCAATAAGAQEAAIRKNLGERLPQLGKIDEVSKTSMPGVFEVRVGSDLYYTDVEGNYLLIHGEMIDVKAKRNITEERVAKLTAFDFEKLPFADAFTIVRGNGKRRMALFEDPNCGYCKHFERDQQKVDNVTIHVFLYPILGPDSVSKSKAIWCARDKGRTWQDWMVRDQAIPAMPAPGCETSVLARNTELGRKHQVTGTPTLVFTDGRRLPGAVGAAEVEKQLADAK
ncbi:MAG: DsbC family protein [Ramlibacter sp.]